MSISPGSAEWQGQWGESTDKRSLLTEYCPERSVRTLTHSPRHGAHRTAVLHCAELETGSGDNHSRPRVALSPPPPDPSARHLPPARTSRLPDSRAHLEDHDVVHQTRGVEAVLEDPLHREGLSCGLPSLQVVGPQHHLHGLEVPTDSREARAMGESPHLHPAAHSGPRGRSGLGGEGQGGDSQAVHAVGCGHDKVPGDERGTTEVTSTPLQGHHEGPSVGLGWPATHNLGGQHWA